MMRAVDLNAISDSNVHGAIYTDCRYSKDICSYFSKIFYEIQIII